MDRAPRIVRAKRKASDDLVLKVPRKEHPRKRVSKGLFGNKDVPLLCGEKDSHSIGKDIFLANSYDNIVKATHVSKDNLLFDGLVEASHVYKYTSANQGKYALDGNSAIEGQHLPMLRDKKELSPSRDEVKEVLRLYHKVLNELLKKNRKALMQKTNVHQVAASILRDRHTWLNTVKRLGSIPGVEVGDEFQYRAELCIIGLHHHFEKGIDYMEKDGMKLATSIVSSGRYPNVMNSSDVLIYSGEGGNPLAQNKRPPKDQALTHGNLALKNNMDQKVPVRVILKHMWKGSKVSTYVYDGIYHVEKCWQERGKFGKLIFKFKLKRISGQPKRTQGLTCKIDKYPFNRKGILASNTFEDNEKVTVGTRNTLDDKRPSSYVLDKTYSVIFNQSKSIGCDCINGCSDFKDCSCKIKNGKVLPYNHNERLIVRKLCIFECGPSCKCYGSCINRVTQRGIRFQLQVFMTKSGRWGVRSKQYIPAGSFICECFGLHQAKEGIEHLFGKESSCDARICQNNRVLPLHNLSHPSFPENDEYFTIDVTEFDNVGSFINHSYSPNLHVQNVLHGDGKKPHLMLFAMKDIHPLQELTYNYNCRTKF